MNKLFIIVLIGAVLVSACIASTETASGYAQDKVETNYLRSGMDLIKICEDRVICYRSYRYSGSSGEGLDCFHDADLVEKYCGDVE